MQRWWQSLSSCDTCMASQFTCVIYTEIFRLELQFSIANGGRLNQYICRPQWHNWHLWSFVRWCWTIRPTPHWVHQVVSVTFGLGTKLRVFKMLSHCLTGVKASWETHSFRFQSLAWCASYFDASVHWVNGVLVIIFTAMLAFRLNIVKFFCFERICDNTSAQCNFCLASGSSFIVFQLLEIRSI